MSSLAKHISEKAMLDFRVLCLVETATREVVVAVRLRGLLSAGQLRAKRLPTSFLYSRCSRSTSRHDG